MYLRFYDLKKNIFQFSTSPDFTWIGDKFERTLSQLEGELVSTPGVYQLIGGIGTGKSTLAGILIQRLPQDFISAEVSDSSLGLMDLLNYLSIAFEIGKQYRSKEEFQPDFEKFLARAASKSQKVLILIDESQALPPKMPCHLQWLMGLDSEKSPVLSILLVGQKDLRKNGAEEEENPLASTILATHSVEPLDLVETTEYIQESLKYAGAEREIFTLDAMQAVYQLSHGVLRNVNILCDNTMIAAHFRKEKEITRARVKASGVDFDLSSDSVVVEEPPSRRVAKKVTRPVFKTVAKTLGATLSITLVAGGIYVYNSIELIPEMEPGSSVVQTKGRKIESAKDEVVQVKAVTAVTEETADNNKRITASGSKVNNVAVLHQGKTKKIIPVVPEQVEGVATEVEEFSKTSDGTGVDAAIPGGISGPQETDSAAVTDDQPSLMLSNMTIPLSESELDVQPYSSPGDLLWTNDELNTPPEFGVLKTSTSRIEALTEKAPLSPPEKLDPTETLANKDPQPGRGTASEKIRSSRSDSGVGPRSAHLVEPKLGIGPGMVSLKNIPTHVQTGTVLPTKETVFGGKSGQQMAANPQPKTTKEPPLAKKDDGQLVYTTMAAEDIQPGGYTVADHRPPASKFQDERMVQPYTPPEEEKTEEIDPGDVIDWLIKKRQKQ